MMLNQPLGRRAFLRGSTLLLTAGALSRFSADQVFAAENSEEHFKIGLITDLHYADKPTVGNRYYRETLAKLSEAAARFQEEQVSFAVELGDLIDSASTLEEELGYLRTINHRFSDLVPHRYYVLGNHCVERLTKNEFLTEAGQEKSFFSFDRSGFHFVVLDACFRGDGQPYGRKNANWTDAFVPPDEVAWLKEDLAATDRPVIVFIHQRLDVSNHYAPKNAAEVRGVLEQSGNVAAVFQGHSHHNDYKDINGIHYCTLAAMIEGAAPDHNGYSVLSLSPDGSLALTGFRKQKTYAWEPAATK